MAPGLGLLPGVVVHQHFTERGHIGRLVGAVALNPASLGVGIDENTATVPRCPGVHGEHGRRFRTTGNDRS
jgi:cyanophycinase